MLVISNPVLKISTLDQILTPNKRQVIPRLIRVHLGDKLIDGPVRFLCDVVALLFSGVGADAVAHELLLEDFTSH